MNVFAADLTKFVQADSDQIILNLFQSGRGYETTEKAGASDEVKWVAWSALHAAIVAQPSVAKLTTVVLSLTDLLSVGAPIRISGSWESLFDDVIAAVQNKSWRLTKTDGGHPFSRVIVLVGLNGAVIVGGGEEKEHRLIFDPTGEESDFEAEYRGEMAWYKSCVIAALATAWAECVPHLAWADATAIGLQLARSLLKNGFDTSDFPNPPILKFPYRKLKDEYYRFEQPVKAEFAESHKDALIKGGPALEQATHKSDVTVHPVGSSEGAGEPWR